MRCVAVVPQTYNWLSEVEIEFGEGRLGVSLREVKQFDTTPYPQFQAEVDDLPKINGKAGPAELYNWSVKPHKYDHRELPTFWFALFLGCTY